MEECYKKEKYKYYDKSKFKYCDLNLRNERNIRHFLEEYLLLTREDNINMGETIDGCGFYEIEVYQDIFRFLDFDLERFKKIKNESVFGKYSGELYEILEGKLYISTKHDYIYTTEDEYEPVSIYSHNKFTYNI